MAARSTAVTFNNNTTSNLTQSGDPYLQHGIWVTKPPQTIKAGDQAVKWESESDGILSGTQGGVTYKFDGTDDVLELAWNNPYAGSNDYHVKKIPTEYSCSISGGDGDNARVTFSLEKKA